MKGKAPHGSNYRQERAKVIMKKGGYARGGATSEPDDCPTKANPTCKKSGGPVSGAAPKKRLDKPRRYASGGGVDEPDAQKSKKGGAKTTVNIVIAGKGGPDAAAAPPPMLPPPGAPAPMPIPAGARPPMGGPPAGMGVPPGAMRRGGAVKKPEYPIDAGAGGGKGRLEKAAASKSSHGPRKRGGKC